LNNFFYKIILILQSFIKRIFFLLYSVILFFDKIVYFFIKKRFLYWLNEFFETSSYTKKKILGKNIIFFTPNEIIDWRIKTFFTKEPETLEWIDSFKGDNIVFWDIGANIGLYSIYAALKHQNIEIVSFEPSVNNLRILSRNIFKNNLDKRIKIFQLPLSEKDNVFSNMNEMEFKEGWSMSTFGETLNFEGGTFKPNHSYQLFGTNINYLLDKKILKFPNYIKIDVDGIEHKILKGADNHLNNISLKSLSVELNENYFEQFNSVKNLMIKNNFEIKQKKQGNISKSQKFSKTYNYVFNKFQI
jgi:FkbM family methyltransferase|tara:strand:- start:627 stop:1532 length:906 start_codon:yes stop_codon:yes gene_type:complete